jgi:Uma2 family endonuclease
LRAHRISTDRPTDERLWGNVGGVAKSGALSWQSPRAATDRGRECVYLGFGHVRIVQDEINADEFLAWAVGQEGRLELHDGAIVAMSPERVVHSRTKGEVFLALRSAILRAGAPCRVYRGGLGLRVNSGTLFEPDAIVACGPPPHEHALEITSPMIVVEVLSPSTAAIDHGPKLMGYFSLPSVEHYLILDPERRVVIHHKRGHADIIETRILRGDGQARSPRARGAGDGNVPTRVSRRDPRRSGNH